MKLTTFFAIAFALLLGTGFFFAARQFGWFEKTAQAKEIVPAKPQTYQILVAADNLYEGIVIDSPKKVKVRELYPSEVRDFEANKSKYMPATPNAAYLRVPVRPIMADTPLTVDLFEPLDIPGGSEERLKPGMRAVNIALPKTRCVGGLIRKDDHVDIFLTSKMLTQGEPENAVVRTACIARNCRVIIKRNSLYTTLTTNPDDKPVNYTLELNPYRAALMEFVQHKGELSMVAIPAPQQKIAAGQYSDPTSKEYADEDERVQGILDSTYTVSDQDLARIFNIKPPAPKPEEPRPIVIRHITGVNASSATVIGPGGNYSSATGGQSSSASQPVTIFLQPGASTDPKDCATCGGKKK